MLVCELEIKTKNPSLITTAYGQIFVLPTNHESVFKEKWWPIRFAWILKVYNLAKFDHNC